MQTTTVLKPRSPRRRRPGIAARVALLCAVLLVTGCGSRLSRDEIVAQNRIDGGSQPAESTSVGAGAGGDVDAGSVLEPTATVGDGTPAGGTDTTPSDAGGAGSSGTAGAGPSDAGSTGAAGTKTPIVIGHVGWLSGIGGLTNVARRDALAAWAKSVNARGGINGHPVKLLIGDDGGNESKSLSLVRDFVENKHAVAIVSYSGGTATAVGNYAASRKVPIIGGQTIEAIWTTNPMLFPTDPAPDGHMYGVARGAADGGKKKVATLYCTEVPACQENNELFVKHAKALGLQVVYQGRISFAQPGYTAECLQARNSGADAVFGITENSSTIRLAQSCGRQAYKPTFLLPVGNDSFTQVPELDGSYASVNNFPWFLHSGSPALDEYGQALKRYAPHLLSGKNNNYGAAGWVSGKLFEKAAEGVSDDPTSAEVLDGLWRMKGETLGGLIVPCTFTRGKATPETFCNYTVQVTGGKWLAPNGTRPTCR